MMNDTYHRVADNMIRDPYRLVADLIEEGLSKEDTDDLESGCSHFMQGMREESLKNPGQQEKNFSSEARVRKREKQRGPLPTPGGGGYVLEPEDSAFDIDQLNKEYALVLIGSKAVVIREQPYAPVEDRSRILSIEAFRSYFSNRLIQIVDGDNKIKVVTWADRWLKHPKRRTYDGIQFHPDPENAIEMQAYFNLWRGFSVQPCKGAGTYKTFQDHLFTNVCGNSEKLYQWVFGWFAHLMQHPRERLGTALVFRGKMGTGKTKIGEVFGSLIDSHYFLVDEPRYIVGQFNAHMAACLLLQAEEAVWAGDKAAEGRLKSLISGTEQMIEAKGIDPLRVKNYVRLIMTSNEDWVIPAGLDERRFAVFDIASHAKGNYDYFKEMDAELNAGGREALLADLLSFDLSKVQLREIPKTTALLEQKVRSLNHVERWWLDRLMAGCPTRKEKRWRKQIPKSEMVDDYLEDSDRVGIKRRSGETEMGITLSRLIPDLSERRIWEQDDNGGGRVRYWVLPPLSACRHAFEELVQQDIEWPDCREQEEEEVSVV